MIALKKSSKPIVRKGPLMVIVMDGVGIGKSDETNAVYCAKTPHLDRYFKEGLYTQLRAHGTAVGLPSDDDMGNSEVGHNALGAGRILAQGAQLVNRAIESHAIFQTDIWNRLTGQVKTHQSALHFIGLLSDGNVHSHIQHLLSMLRKVKADGVRTVRVHPLLDGRDVGEKTALVYLAQLEAVLAELNTDGCDYRIASGGGRMITTMDRYFADWSVVKRGWDAHVLGKGRAFASAKDAVETMYLEDPKMTDQYFPAFVITQNGQPVGPIQDHDSVIFFNFRGDRAIEISMAFEHADFAYFDRERVPNVVYAGMMQYDGDLKIPQNFLVAPPVIENTLSEYLCSARVPSFAISETQKFGHVTYFWNGNRSGYVCKDIEEYDEIPSDKIAFDQAPLMKVYEIADKTMALLNSGKFKFGRVNFANGDMVGHTGVMPAAITAMEAVDTCVGKVVELVRRLGGITIITADHGNADEMFTVKNGVKTPKTAHTLNPVPFVIIDSVDSLDYQLAPVQKPGLANVAATVCNLLGYDQPADYEPSLIQPK